MATFTGNLRTIGIEPRAGLYPEITCTATNAGVDLVTGDMFAGSRTFTPDAGGDITLNLASTLNLVPETRVKLTGRWLGDDFFFELPEFHVPNISGTLGYLLAYSGITSQQYIVWGLGPPDDNLPGGDYRNLSTDPVGIYKRGPL